MHSSDSHWLCETETDQSSWDNEEIYWLLQMDRMLLQLPGLKEGLQEPRYKSQNRDSVLPSCSLNFSSLCSLAWLLHLVGKMPCPQPQAHSVQLCALYEGGALLPASTYQSQGKPLVGLVWVMCPPLGPITSAGGWASMIGAVWVTCRPADTGVGTMGVVEL